MREGWTYKKWADVLTIINGKNQTAVESKDGEYPIYGSGGIMGYANNWLCPENCVVIGRKGNINKPIFVTTKFWNVDTAFGLKAHDNSLLPKFLFYFCQDYNFERHNKAVTIPSLTKADLLKINIPIPSLSEQQSIVAELDKINELISLKKAQLSDLDALAQSIFYDMFGNLQDDTPLSHFINSLGGGKSLAGKVPCINKVLKTGAVTYDCFDSNAVKDLPIDYVPLPEHLLKDGDLLVSRMNTPELVGSCAYVWKAPDNTYLPDRLWRAVLKQGNNPIYLWFSIIQLKAKEQIRTLASGTSGSMKNISKPRFLSVKIKNAPLSLQQDFAKRIELIEQQKAQISSTIKDLETLLASRMQYWFD